MRIRCVESCAFVCVCDECIYVVSVTKLINSNIVATNVNQAFIIGQQQTIVVNGKTTELLKVPLNTTTKQLQQQQQQQCQRCWNPTAQTLKRYTKSKRHAWLDALARDIDMYVHTLICRCRCICRYIGSQVARQHYLYSELRTGPRPALRRVR